MSDTMEAASPGPGGSRSGPGPPSTDSSPGPATPPDGSSSPAPPAPPMPPQPQHNGSPTDSSRLVQSGNVTTISVGSPHTPTDKAGKIIKYYPPTCNGNIASDQEGRCSVLVGSTDHMPIVNDDDITGPDMEISNIHFKGVNMRCKKKLDPNLSEDSHDDFVKEEQERPMSWEGELSDTEMSVVNGSGISLKHEHEDSMEGVQLSVVHNTPISDSRSGNIHFGDSEEREKHNQVNVVDSHGQSQEGTPVTTSCELPLLVDKLLSDGGCYKVTPSNSPVLSHRHLQQSISKQSSSSQSGSVPPNPSPDSAIHSAYSYSSPAQSPVTSRHGSHGLPSSGFSSPYTPSLSRNNSDASQYGGSQHSSCYSQSYSSVSVSPTQFSPTHSPIQSRHLPPGAPRDLGSNGLADDRDGFVDDRMASLAADLVHHPGLSAPPGISRQQLINSPCPICGDKISGFHYGIFSCESCKGFFKRTVQNRKNYVCLRGSTCLVTIATRKKCPACRFEKCLRKGMKLEAIREDRTRGGRSTYQISYTLPPTMVVPGAGESGTSAGNSASSASGLPSNFGGNPAGELQVKLETPDAGVSGAGPSHSMSWSGVPSTAHRLTVPPLLQEIMEVEHLWNCNDQETQQKHCPSSPGPSSSSSNSTGTSQSGSRVSSSRISAASSSSESSGGNSRTTNGSSDSGPDFLNLCNIADHRLYKIVKWCKSLPLFKNISIDDQIILLLNAWCELLLFSCCFRSMSTPGEIRVSLGKSITLAQAKELGLGPCIERMLNLTDHLRRLRVDKFEYVAMKAIILLTSDASDLHESEKVRASQEKALQALQHYTLDHYPDIPSKFGELLLRIPDLQRTCQVGKEMLSIKNKEGEGPSFMLLMELLRGDH